MTTLHNDNTNKPEWRLTYDGVSADKTATYFAFPDYATNAEINAKLEKKFFKTPYMDWFIMNDTNRVVVYVNAQEYYEWKREQDEDEDSDDEDE